MPLGPSSKIATAVPPLPTPIAGWVARTPTLESVCVASKPAAPAGSRAATTLLGAVDASHTTVALPAASMATWGIRPAPSGNAGPNVPPGRRRAASTTPESRAQAATAVPSGATATATAGSCADSAVSGNGGSHDGAATAGAAVSRAPAQSTIRKAERLTTRAP